MSIFEDFEDHDRNNALGILRTPSHKISKETTSLDSRVGDFEEQNLKKNTSMVVIN